MVLLKKYYNRAIKMIANFMTILKHINQYNEIYPYLDVNYEIKFLCKSTIVSYVIVYVS